MFAAKYLKFHGEILSVENQADRGGRGIVIIDAMHAKQERVGKRNLVCCSQFWHQVTDFVVGDLNGV
jgi:hypothetical protein